MTTEKTATDALAGASTTHRISPARAAAGRHRIRRPAHRQRRQIDDYQVHAERIAQARHRSPRRPGTHLVRGEPGRRAASPTHSPRTRRSSSPPTSCSASAPPPTLTRAPGAWTRCSCRRWTRRKCAPRIRAGISESRLTGRRPPRPRRSRRLQRRTRRRYRQPHPRHRPLLRPHGGPPHRPGHAPRRTCLVPEDLIQKMAGLGLFGCSIPETYGGTEMGYLTMVVLTEELSTVVPRRRQPHHPLRDPHARPPRGRNRRAAPGLAPPHRLRRAPRRRRRHRTRRRL